MTTGAGWVYTCPNTGYYQVSCNLLFGSASWTQDVTIAIEAFKNGTTSFKMAWRRVGYTATTLQDGGVGITTVNASGGDTLQLRLFQNEGSNRSLFIDNGENNWIVITQIQ